MNLSGVRLLFAGVAAFLVALPVYLPADRVLHALSDHIPANLNWQVSGTVLHPYFHRLELDLPPGIGVVLEDLHADISILPLLLGQLRIRFELESGEDSITGSAILKRHHWQISGIKGQLPAEAIMSIVPALGLAGSDGMISVDGEHLSADYNDIPQSGVLRVVAMQLRPDLPGLDMPLGDYKFDLNIDPRGGIAGTVTTLRTDAPLHVRGELSVDPGVRLLRFDGDAEATASANDTVRALLPLFGVVENNRARIQWQTVF